MTNLKIEAATKPMTAAQIEMFFTTLRAANPQPVTELEYTSVFELLAAVLLSAQATDVGVNKATRRLFPVANTPKKIGEFQFQLKWKHTRAGLWYSQIILKT